MRIAQVPPLYEAVPPRLYGGTERVVAHLTDALVDLGHDVTLFASGDARTKAELVVVRDQAIRLDPAPLKSDLAAHMAMLAEVRRQAHRFDVIHFHTDMIHFPMFEDMPGRTLTTLHGRLDLKDLPGVYQALAAVPAGLDLGRPAPPPALRQLGRHGAARHGRGNLRFPAKSEGYLAFLGRISPEKGPDRAIAIAKRLGKPLKIAAKIDAADRPISTTRSSTCWTIR
jgi:glycosyltransferase involved in cell wall biosynthesis